ncbi:hypothetical protein [Fluviicola sp.]|uniref:hypothetical protein n=1 Tax=Fluviicola sp. TaxID=1917219 RepID=UPI0031E2795B
MKTVILFFAMLGFGLSSQAATLFEQLCAFNPNWKKYQNQVPEEGHRSFYPTAIHSGTCGIGTPGITFG